MKKKRIVFPLFCLLVTLLLLSCSDDGEEGSENDTTALPPPDMSMLSETTIWDGPSLTFQKAAGTDPNLPENQDRITNAVWITRGNDGGQIYNAVTENEAESETSPAGTMWAVGTTADLEDLSFDRFRSALGKPKDRVGEDLVLLLVDENIAIDVRITAWAQGQVGGFTYVRSTAPE
ncbi:MAG: hypothetical protein AAF634_01325 [Bacteroidota bacterium]